MSGRAGYSLFEVLIAFAIMAMTLSVILPRQSALLTRIGEVDSRLAAQDLALSHLALLYQHKQPFPEEHMERIGDWTLRRTVSPERLPSLPIELVRVTVTIESETGRELSRLTELRRRQ